MRYILLATLLSMINPAARGQSALVQADTTSGWQVVFSSPKLTFASLVFPTKDTGYAFASDRVELLLFRTTNGGLTWDSVPTVVPTQQLSTTFSSGLTGFCEGGPINKTIGRTTDGGNTWTQFPENANSSGPMAFASGDTGIVLGFETNARTTDGGMTWNEVEQPIGLVPNAACFGDAKTGYAVGSQTKYPPRFDLPEAGYCEKTTDAGATWTQVYTGIPDQLQTCFALNESILFVGGAAAYVGRTTNGGQSWDTIRFANTRTYFSSIWFANPMHGITVGNDNNQGINSHGIIFSTNDGGLSWRQQYLPSPPELLSVIMLSDSVAVVCGGGNIYRTTTGGLPAGVHTQPSIDFGVQVFPNPTPGVVNISYTLPSATTVSFIFSDERGVVVASTAPGLNDAGPHVQRFDGTVLPSGTYFFKMTTGLGVASGAIEVEK